MIFSFLFLKSIYCIRVEWFLESIAVMHFSIYLNSTFLKLDYVLSLTENVMLNTSLLSVFARIIEGLLLIGISLLVFVFRTKKHS